MYRADMLAFVAPQGAPPITVQALNVDLLHLTSVPPFIDDSIAAIRANYEFKSVLEGQEYPHSAKLEGFVSNDRKRFRLIKSGQQLREPKKGRVDIVLGMQNAPQNLTLSYVRYLRQFGISFMAIAYDRTNRFGGGFLEPNAPLTDDGRRLLEWMATAGVILDLSHAGHRTACQALEFMEDESLPLAICASHGGCYDGIGGCSNPRNLLLTVLSDIARLGGMVGIYTLTFGLHNSDDTLAPFVAHLKEAVCVCGTNCVGVGTDGVYQIRALANWHDHFDWMNKKLNPDERFTPRWPDQPLALNRPDRMDVVADALREAGFSEFETARMIGLNFRDFVIANLR